MKPIWGDANLKLNNNFTVYERCLLKRGIRYQLEKEDVVISNNLEQVSNLVFYQSFSFIYIIKVTARVSTH